MPSPSKEPTQAVQDASNNVKTALSLLSASIAAPSYVDAFLTFGRAGVRELIAKAPAEAAVLFMEYISRAFARMGDVPSEASRAERAKEAAKQVAWNIFWKGVLGFPEAPPLKKGEQSQPAVLTSAERSLLEKLISYLAQAADVAIQHTHRLFKEGKVPLSTEFSDVPDITAVRLAIGHEGTVSKSAWLDHVFLKHAKYVEKIPLSDIAWQALSALVDKEWLASRPRGVDTGGKTRAEYLADIASAYGARSKIYRYILEPRGVETGLAKELRDVLRRHVPLDKNRNRKK